MFASRASATWSIVGVDRDTGESGVAIASCVPAEVLGDLTQPLSPVALAPGVGAGVSQAALNEDVPPEIVRLLAAGEGPAAIIGAVTDDGFDSDSSIRQHAVVTIGGGAAGFTGAENDPVALDRQSEEASAQGNILVREAVIEDALAAFNSADGDLATRLVAALVAGAEAGGDSRCGDQTALFAHVAVAVPGDDPNAPSVLLTYSAAEGSGENPVSILAQQFDSGTRKSTPANSSGGISGVAIASGAAILVAGLLGVAWFIRRRPSPIGVG